MAMVGLFWIVEGDVYVGAKPSGESPGVRLTPEGVLALGHGQAGLYPWEDVGALTVVDVPVKSLKRQVGAVADMALGTVLAFGVGSGGGDDAPPLMTVRLAASGDERELGAYAAAAVGYTATEVELSRAVLARLTEGAATMSTTLAEMSRWGRAREGGSPRAGEREALLRGWADR
ncbi:hypothetical protein [Streptomyces sp. NPDC049906]|uniref:hypothetical protein n=1 Tax=Streptomyces sp. NPDC049906 TaxID=3155656 RepID=UPI00342AA5A5